MQIDTDNHGRERIAFHANNFTNQLVEPTRLSSAVTAHDHAQGAEMAAVTLVEYGDYECPHCRAAHTIISQLQQRFGSDLRFIFRHFPLTQIHQHAQRAAEATEAAGAQGRFWEMHNLLFTSQIILNDSHIVSCADDLGLNVMRFLRDMTEHAHAGRVREDLASGLASGVSGTPTFFINGVLHDAAWQLDILQNAIEQRVVRKGTSCKE